MSAPDGNASSPVHIAIGIPTTSRILVTGGAGFLGSHLVSRLLADDYEVGVVDNLSFGRRSHLPLQHPRLHFAQIDICDRLTLAGFFTSFQPEAVIHLAALHFIPYCNAHPLAAAEVNILGTDNVLGCCKTAGPQVVFLASSAAVYAVGDDANFETSAVAPTDIYGITKYAGERLAELYHRRTGGRAVVGRLFNIYGPNETNPHVIPEILAQVNAGATRIELGNTQPKRDFIHTTDVVSAIQALIGTGDEQRWAAGTSHHRTIASPTPPAHSRPVADFGVFNIGTGVEHSVEEIVSICAELVGRDIKIVQTAERSRKVERMHLRADISSIQTATGWAPRVSLSEGLAALLTTDA